MQYILGQCIKQGIDRLQTLLLLPLHLPLSVCTVRLSVSSPPPSSLPLLMLIILSVLPPSPGIAPRLSSLSLSLLTFTHYWIQTYIHSCAIVCEVCHHHAVDNALDWQLVESTQWSRNRPLCTGFLSASTA